MGGGGFEPPKQFAADLQSVPFGHSGIHPFVCSIVLTRNDYNTAFSIVQELFIQIKKSAGKQACRTPFMYFPLLIRALDCLAFSNVDWE